MLRAETGVVRNSQIPSRAPTSSASAMVYLEELPKWKVSDLSALGVPFRRMVADAPTLPLCSEPSVYIWEHHYVATWNMEVQKYLAYATHKPHQTIVRMELCSILYHISSIPFVRGNAYSMLWGISEDHKR